MREPRPRQRFPEGGLEIYEQRKAGTWKHPLLMFAQPTNWISPIYGKLATPRSLGYVLIYQPHFDPMLYFWPVEGCHLIIRTDNADSEHTQRLVRAALRDGAEIVVAHNATALSSHSKFFTQEQGWKKPTNEILYEVPERKLRGRVR